MTHIDLGRDGFITLDEMAHVAARDGVDPVVRTVRGFRVQPFSLLMIERLIFSNWAGER